jgi:hypothetical protein
VNATVKIDMNCPHCGNGITMSVEDHEPEKRGAPVMILPEGREKLRQADAILIAARQLRDGYRAGDPWDEALHAVIAAVDVYDGTHP